MENDILVIFDCQLHYSANIKSPPADPFLTHLLVIHEIPIAHVIARARTMFNMIFKLLVQNIGRRRRRRVRNNGRGTDESSCSGGSVGATTCRCSVATSGNVAHALMTVVLVLLLLFRMLLVMLLLQ